MFRCLRTSQHRMDHVMWQAGERHIDQVPAFYPLDQVFLAANTADTLDLHCPGRGSQVGKALRPKEPA